METNHQEWEERGLRAAVLAGDEAAWRVLYERHFDSLYAFVFVRAGCNADQAEDVVQECWAVAVRRIRSFSPSRGCFGDWLRGIANHVLLGRRRRWARRNRLEQSALPAAEAGASGPPSDTVERVAWVLTSLPQPYEAVLRAKYAEQRAVAEIAQGWGRSAKAIESLLSRAREAFRQAWRRTDEGSENAKG